VYRSVLRFWNCWSNSVDFCTRGVVELHTTLGDLRMVNFSFIQCIINGMNPNFLTCFFGDYERLWIIIHQTPLDSNHNELSGWEYRYRRSPANIVFQHGRSTKEGSNASRSLVYRFGNQGGDGQGPLVIGVLKTEGDLVLTGITWQGFLRGWKTRKCQIICLYMDYLTMGVYNFVVKSRLSCLSYQDDIIKRFRRLISLSFLNLKLWSRSIKFS
jgi:hypothetical protein